MIFKTLRDIDQPWPSYVWKASLIALVPTLVISGLMLIVSPEAGRPEFDGPVLPVAFAILVLGPWAETLLLWLTLAILKVVNRRPTFRIVACALLWAILHSLAAPIWGLCVFWPFVVFSTSFIEWQKKSTLKAIWVTSLIHMCQNSLGLVTLVFLGIAWLTKGSRRAAVPVRGTSPAVPER